MNLLELIGVSVAASGTLMVAVWLASVALRDVSIVDIFWGPGFVVIAWATFCLTGETSIRKALLVGLVTAWGLRLAVHLGLRKIGAPEDHRYQSMREKIGPRFWLASLFIVFGLQTIVMGLVALPVLTGQLDRSPPDAWMVLGVAIWAVGFFFESIGDYQLTRFRADPNNRGKVMDRGLWRFTRHPNYFGDALVWWGIFFVALGDGSAWWTIFCPVAMTILLLRVSGVTLIERSLENRKDGYTEYKRRTSAFVPWPPRSGA